MGEKTISAKNAEWKNGFAQAVCNCGIENGEQTPRWGGGQGSGREQGGFEVAALGLSVTRKQSHDPVAQTGKWLKSPRCHDPWTPAPCFLRFR
jgi:hypothetical protein